MDSPQGPPAVPVHAAAASPSSTRCAPSSPCATPPPTAAVPDEAAAAAAPGDLPPRPPPRARRLRPAGRLPAAGARRRRPRPAGVGPGGLVPRAARRARRSRPPVRDLSDAEVDAFADSACRAPRARRPRRAAVPALAPSAGGPRGRRRPRDDLPLRRPLRPPRRGEGDDRLAELRHLPRRPPPGDRPVVGGADARASAHGARSTSTCPRRRSPPGRSPRRPPTTRGTSLWPRCSARKYLPRVLRAVPGPGAALRRLPEGARAAQRPGAHRPGRRRQVGLPAPAGLRG